MTDYDVIICGLGPVGQLLALLLGDRGVRTLAFDREPRALPAAASGGHRRRGAADLPVRRARRGGARRRAGPAGREHRHRRRPRRSRSSARGRAGSATRRSSRSTSRRWSARCSPRSSSRPSVDVRRGLTLEALDRRADRVDAFVRPTDGGRSERISARWLVGCDGAASAVRARLEIPLEGCTNPQRWIVVDALVDRPLRKVPHPHFVGDAKRPMVTLPMSPGRHRWEWMLHPGEDAAPHLEPAAVGARSSEWLDGESARDRARGRLHVPHAHGRPLAPRPRAAGGRRGAPDAAVRRPGLLVGRARRRQPGLEARRRPRRRAGGAARHLRARAPPARRRDAAAGEGDRRASCRRRARAACASATPT